MECPHTPWKAEFETPQASTALCENLLVYSEAGEQDAATPNDQFSEAHCLTVAWWYGSVQGAMHAWHLSITLATAVSRVA
jgi:hypothetical protein